MGFRAFRVRLSGFRSFNQALGVCVGFRVLGLYVEGFRRAQEFRERGLEDWGLEVCFLLLVRALGVQALGARSEGLGFALCGACPPNAPPPAVSQI